MRLSALTAQPVPWKNGGGVTRELASHTEDGPMVWRLSLADIARSGPFSAFPGLARIHCIVEGAGHILSDSELRLEAWPLKPLCFDGGLDLSCSLRDGPCTAFNVIYDPARVRADACVLGDGPVPAAGGMQALFVVSGSLNLGALGGFAAGEGLVTEEAALGRLSDGGKIIQVRFSPV